MIQIMKMIPASIILILWTGAVVIVNNVCHARPFLAHTHWKQSPFFTVHTSQTSKRPAPLIGMTALTSGNGVTGGTDRMNSSHPDIAKRNIAKLLRISYYGNDDVDYNDDDYFDIDDDYFYDDIYDNFNPSLDHLPLGPRLLISQLHLMMRQMKRTGRDLKRQLLALHRGGQSATVSRISIWVDYMSLQTRQRYKQLQTKLRVLAKSIVEQPDYQLLRFVGSGVLLSIISTIAYTSIRRRQINKQLSYLIYDAIEIIPEIWYEMESELLLSAIEEEEKEHLQNIDEKYEQQHLEALKKLNLRKRNDLQQYLEEQVRRAKAIQIATLYPKHFANEWHDIIEKQQKNSTMATESKDGNDDQNDDDTVVVVDENNVQFLVDHPKLLCQLTKELYHKKFTALLRPDYMFGIGRNGIDLMSITNNNKDQKNDKMIIDPLLLETVTQDLETTCPTDHPEIWKEYTLRLLPRQTLWDRHDIVLKMVKAIQLEKKQNNDDVPESTHSNKTKSTANERRKGRKSQSKTGGDLIQGEEKQQSTRRTTR